MIKKNIKKEQKLDKILLQVRAELIKASNKHGSFNSPHEGYAVLKEEVDELWDDIKKDEGTSPNAILEAKQIAAMAIRYMLDLTEG